MKSCGAPFVALELDAATVRAARTEGVPVYYGDATSEEALGHAHIANARALVLFMNEPVAMQRVIVTASRVSGAETQASPRAPTGSRATLAEQTALADLRIESALVRAGSAAEGKSATDLETLGRKASVERAVKLLF